MDHYNLFEHADQFVTREKFTPERDRSHFYPSEASVKYYDEHGDLTVAGTCQRAAYFRIVGGYEKAPFDAYTEWIFKMGNEVEKMLTNTFKEMGIWVDNSVRFYDEENNISGELDVLLREPNGVIYPAEIKSAYGYFAEKEIFGNKSQEGKPKLGQLLQLLVYLNYFKDDFSYGRMIYFFRDSTKRKTFKVGLEYEGNIIYPKVDDKVMRSFTINDMLNRYKELGEFVDTKTVPPKDYQLQYPPNQIKDFYAKKKISKTKFANWQNGKLKPYEYVGDWQCNFCRYKKSCFPDAIDPPTKTHL